MQQQQLKNQAKTRMQAAAATTDNSNEAAMTDETNNQPPREIELFGGAIVATLPGKMRDISDFVPVPDNQEIYQDMTKAEAEAEASANYGQVIFEILDQVEKSDEDALPFLFNDLAEVNQSEETSIERVEAVTEQATITKIESILGGAGTFHLSVL